MWTVPLACVLGQPTGLGTDLLCHCWFDAVGGRRDQAGPVLETGVFPEDPQSLQIDSPCSECSEVPQLPVGCTVQDFRAAMAAV